ncbi:hypothetical protein [Dysgonomonas macrotermitis]|uniref:Uncharacterized protein n=1 Tax=Dysgonomonas macrotermitis TaxID=1346286 RepID=A0A1M4YE46_9BACT|nr:hypothetical protein [Dysgonomonas macrotermitis]SHF03999.1 hypothetical protein SAMN05444362_103145 [Dysgonomonas macrotermitis]
MKKKLIFIIFLIPTILYSQNYTDSIRADIAHLYLKEDIQKAFDETVRILKQKRKDYELNKLSMIIPVYRYCYKSILSNMSLDEQWIYLENNNLSFIPLPRKDFLDSSFYKNLLQEPRYIKKKNNIFLWIDFYLIDNTNNPIGYGNAESFYFFNKQYSGRTFVDIINELNITDMFIITDLYNMPVICKTKDGHVYVWESQGMDAGQLFSIEEYIKTNSNYFK